MKKSAMSDEEYNKKLDGLQKYIPFLDNMIAQLKDPSKKNREQQLNKMESLHSMITDRKKRLKLETLNKCEDVITKLFEKVNHKPLGQCKTGINSPKFTSAAPTPASPSPPRGVSNATPPTIPTERSEPQSRIAKIDVYSSAAESLKKQKHSDKSVKGPDISKPPISLEDLKTLEEDVHDKINQNASLSELNGIRDKIAHQLILENIKSISPSTSRRSNENVNTPPRNSIVSSPVGEANKTTPIQLNLKSPMNLKAPSSTLTSILIDIDDEIAEDKSKMSEERIQSLNGKNEKSKEGRNSTSVKEVKKSDDKSKSVKDEHSKDKKLSLQGPATDKARLDVKEKLQSKTDDSKDKSTFGSHSGKHKERRLSLSGKVFDTGAILEKNKDKKSVEKLEDKDKLKPKENDKHSQGKDVGSKKKDAEESKTKEKEDGKKREKSESTKKEKEEDKKGNKDDGRKKDRDKHESNKTDKKSKEDHRSISGKSNDSKSKEHDKSKDAEPKNKENIKIRDEKNKRHEIGIKSDNINTDGTKDNKSDANSTFSKIVVRKVEDLKEKVENTTSTYKRLADKYNPKPRKQTTEPEVDKAIDDIIEANMKISPPKIPVLNRMIAPVPPPPSLVLCSQAEPELPGKKYPSVLQSLMNPSTTQLINTVVHHLRQTNAESEKVRAHPTPTPPLMQIPPLMQKTPLLSPPPLMQNPILNHFPSLRQNPNLNQIQNTQNMLISPTDSFVSDYVRDEPVDNFVSKYARDDYSSGPRIQFDRPVHDQFAPTTNPRFTPNAQDNFRQQRTFFGGNDMFNQPYQGEHMQPLDYYPPNAPVPSNQFNGGPPLLSPEVSHFQDQKPNNFGMMSHREMCLHKEDLRWRLEDNRPPWERRDYEPWFRGPSTYREHREMRESRDPRVLARDPRENRNIKDPRDNRNARDHQDLKDIRDPRINRDPRDRDLKDPRVNMETDTGRSRNRERYDSKFDRIYSRTNELRARSRSRSASTSRSDAKDNFLSPLDSLYSGKEEKKTGKGYGVQNFRIPKIKKEETEKPSEAEPVKDVEEDEGQVVEKLDVEDESDSEKEDAQPECEIVEDEMENNEVVEDANIENEQEKVEDTAKVMEIVEEVKENESATNALNEEPVTDKDAPQTEPSTSTKETEPEEPASKPTMEQSILAQFFANLLGTNDKSKKKTALYSLISTFSDTFSPKELTKIAEIIKTDDPNENISDEEKECSKKQDETLQVEKPEEHQVEEAAADEIIKRPKRSKSKKRIRRISSTSPSKDDKNNDAEVAHSDEPTERHDTCKAQEKLETHEVHETREIPRPELEIYPEDDNIVVTVGERIKSRKRASSIPKPKKKCRTELDMLHEDIQDMFIRDGVLTATGKRMCRLLKDDPSVLLSTSTEVDESSKIRKKPGPKSKSKVPSASDMRAMKSVRVVISKIPESAMEETGRAARRLTRSMTFAESDDDISVREDADHDSDKEYESEIESSDSEREDTSSQTSEGTLKTKKRKRVSNWASGVIKKKYKKKKQPAEDAAVSETTPNEEETVKDTFLEPDKNYYVDFASQKQHACKLCDYVGKFITTHYKSTHPDSEVLTSRFSPVTAAEAISDSNMNLAKYESCLRRKPSKKIHFTCRFCSFKTNIPPTLFYDHLSTHTGEYRHICPVCDFSACSAKTLKHHITNTHPHDDDKTIVRKSYNETIMFGYMCGECNYVQLNLKNIEEHVNIFHLTRPRIHKVNMSTLFDPEIENIAKSEPVTDYTAVDESEEIDKSMQPQQVETKPMSKSKKRPAPANIIEPTDVQLEESAQEAEKVMIPPVRKRSGPKPGPKSRKKFIERKSSEVETDGTTTDTESVSSNLQETSAEAEPLIVAVVVPRMPAAINKRRSTSMLQEEDILPARSKRAAKEKAQGKIKTLMESTEIPTRRKNSVAEVERQSDSKGSFTDTAQILDDCPKDVEKSDAAIKSNETDSSAPSAQVGIPENNDAKVANNQSNMTEGIVNKEAEVPAQLETVVKKEIDMNVFTCKTDLLEENKKIEQERVQMMDELNKEVGSRTSLNFVDQLCTRLSKNEVVVKQEPRDDLTDSLFPRDKGDAPLIMPILEKNLPMLPPQPIPGPSTISTSLKKPVFETNETQMSTPSYDVTQKNDKVIMNMIEKLKGKLETAKDSNLEHDSSIIIDDNGYDSEGPPPLTLINNVVNIQAPDESTKMLLVGGLVKVIKTSVLTTFCCLVPPCVFSTQNKDEFQVHCKEHHGGNVLGRSSTLCETCGLQVETTENASLLENLFTHTITEHADFLNDSTNPDPIQPRALRLRKLSGDALSIIKKDWEEEIDNDKVSSPDAATLAETDNNKENQGGEVENEAVQISIQERTPTMAEIETDDNPFPFKISEVMSLADPQPVPPPPLAPFAKPSVHFVFKEVKIPPAELAKPKKAEKAMMKFIESVSDLYKCPHYFCLFTTSFRDFFERHLKAHHTQSDVMIPCVYCDIKTSWEHVPMHIDIRHANCRFACSYCLYRAIVKEYVFLHQDKMHPESDYSVIGLPISKSIKKYAVTETKPDPKTLCVPYKCSNYCNMEFLFENEFKRHLTEAHSHSVFITCGYPSCNNRMMTNKMPQHWSTVHNVSLYQCGHCKLSCSDAKLMYQHYALQHQNVHPEILLRVLTPLQDGLTLGYSSEAFRQMRKLASVPISPTSHVKTSVVATLPTCRANIISPFSKMNQVTPAKTKCQNVKNSIPAKILNKSMSLYSAGNISLCPNPIASTSSADMLQEIGATVSTYAGPAAKKMALSDTPGLPTPVTSQPAVTLENQDIATPVEEQLSGNVLNVAPLELVTVPEEQTGTAEDPPDTEVDPLDLGEIDKTAADAFSSEDESDVGKIDKSKKKCGLLGYQLYRCAYCDYSCTNSNDLKKHVSKSSSCKTEVNYSKPYRCVHCSRHLRNPQALVDHIQCHGILRFTCSLCENKFPTSNQARGHMKHRHNVSQSSMTPLNPLKTNFDTDEYLLKPKQVHTASTPKETPSSEQCMSSPPEENVFMPEDIDKIPIRSIFSTSLRCGVCSYSTKVRTNLVRHLHFHSEEKAVPDTAPVNPVPCLEKNEKMFDKMINMASSSHNVSRMGGAGKLEVKHKEADNIPEYVPTTCRFVCCAKGCSYMCPEEGNLRHHLIALHDGEESFMCVHCKTNLAPTDADSLLKHFKLHGLQLYKCCYCDFVHNLKHKVEKHLSDNHADLPNNVITVRFLESEPKEPEEPSTSIARAVTPIAVPSRSMKPWRCCMCKTRSISQEGIQHHVLEKHEIDAQFKCALCAYKTNAKDTFEGHFKEAHDDQQINVIHVYRKIEEGPKEDKERSAFDTTPLWQRDRPRVRHIRGILFDDSSPVVVKSPKKLQKVGMTSTPSTSAPATTKESNLDISIESVANGTAEILNSKLVVDSPEQVVEPDDENTSEETHKSKDSSLIVIDDDDESSSPSSENTVSAKHKEHKISPSAKNRGVKRKVMDVPGISKLPKISDVIDVDISNGDSDENEYSEKNLVPKFGGFGQPLNRQLRCPKCNQFKSKRISDFIFHMYKEMKVYRFKCLICDDESITYRYMYKHVKEHNTVQRCNDNILALPPNPELEVWLQMLIKKQCILILPSVTYMVEPPDVKDRKALCHHCNKWFRSEQEKNEHAIVHWVKMPYSCDSCQFMANTYSEVEKHSESRHNSFSLNVLCKGPTVGKELKYADDLHMREVQQEVGSILVTSFTSPVQKDLVKEVNIAEILVPERRPSLESLVDNKLMSVQEMNQNSNDFVAVSENSKDAFEVNDNALVIVTKTESNVPSDNDVFCCDYCPYMSTSETLMLSHISGRHEHMHLKFRTLNRVECESTLSEYVGCMLCPEVGSEIKIRQHHLEKHDGQTFLTYRLTCTYCGKRFLKIGGLKNHSARAHTGLPLKFTELIENAFHKNKSKAIKDKPRQIKRYKCTLCSYTRNFPSSNFHNVRSHVRNHFKSYVCGGCDLKFRNRSDALCHSNREHPHQHITHDTEQDEQFLATIAQIVRDATVVEETQQPVYLTVPVVKSTARKSTSAPQKPAEEFSYYGSVQEQVDWTKISTSVEVNGMCLNMTADKLSKVFDLEPQVLVEDCNMSINLAEMFDS